MDGDAATIWRARWADSAGRCARAPSGATAGMGRRIPGPRARRRLVTLRPPVPAAYAFLVVTEAVERTTLATGCHGLGPSAAPPRSRRGVSKRARARRLSLRRGRFRRRVRTA